jgi:RHS repeat-associated protein
MRSFRRIRGVRAVVLCVFLSGITAVANPAVAAAAGGPSVELPTIPSVPVAEQWMQNRPADEATTRALKNDQQAGGATPAGQGTSKATPLSPSATWDVSLRTGDFNWSYPLKVPPSPGGLSPNLSLTYSSSAVDGRTSVTNNQPSWVGDGWSLSPGFIERTYGTCSEDTEGGTTPPSNAADLCWRSDNAVASSGVGAGQLIRNDANGVWRPKNDDGSRVERIYELGKGDADGEYWKVTSVDGTQYFYGARPESKSVWTVPVFGDDLNEPCHRDTFDASSCSQAWRWNLDKVIDRNGNSIIYTYETETNSYGFNRQDAAVSYIRGGTLARAEYGMRDGTADRPTGQMVFTPTDRCVPNSTCTPDKKENWPDVPWDDKCDTATCAHRHWPTFWSTKRLDSIVTQVWRGTSYADVDSWKLEHQYPDPNSGEKAALWLRSIKRTGLVGGSFPLPPVVFEGTPMANRVDSGDAVGALRRYRVTGVISEAGGLTTVNYAPTDCSPTSLPGSVHNNTKRCYPSTWKPPFASTERTDYFHKYVVDTVVVSDRLAQNGSDPEHPLASPEQLVRYEYLDGAAWHYSDSEFTKDDKKTWDEFRGYGRVRVHTGKPFDPGGNPITMTEQRFYRGMDGDHQPTGTRSETVADSENGVRADSDWLQGFVLETRTHKGETNDAVEKTINTPVWKETAVRSTATGETYRAHFVGIKTTKSYTALASGGWRTTEANTTYDDYGRATKVDDLGDKATAADDRCTTTTYVDNPTKWLMTFPSRVETVSVHCDATPVFPQNALSDTVASYDGQEPGIAPITGNVTRQQVLKERPASGPPEYVVSRTATYDTYGRSLTVADVLARTTKMVYEQTDGGPTTKTIVSNELGHTVTTTLDPAWGAPLKSTNPNGLITENAYDGLGRVVETWLPNRRRDLNSNRGNVRYSYQVRNDGPTVVTTTSIGPNGNYVSTNTLYDPQYRPRQVQAPTEGGRLLTDTRYDSQGRVYKTTQPYFNAAPVDTKLWVASDTEVPGLAFTEFDDAGRPTASIYKAGANEKWRTTTTYGGDRVSVTPPAGGTPTTTITDARGQTTELWQYKSATATGDHDTTKYTYTPAGQLASSTDPAGNTWRWTYDLRGRQVKADDIDKGTSTSTYDDANQLLSVTDARGSTLAHDYDRLGRRTTVREGGPTGTIRTQLTYDTAAFGKGQLATATRYVNGNAYTQRVDSYGTLGVPTRSSLVIPESEGVLRGTYTTIFGYTWTGSLASIVYPKAGPLLQEDMYFRRDDFDRPTSSYANYVRTVNLVTGMLYTRYGEPQRMQLGDAGKRTWQSSYYDTNTRRLDRSIVDAEVTAPMQSDVNYTRDPAGNITSLKDDSPGAAERQCFTYDYLRRLTEAWTPTGDCTSAPSTSSLSGPGPYWQSFTYDSVGNRRTETQHASAGNTVRTYGYPPTGRALQSVQTQGPATSTLDEFGYDAAGNTTRRKVTSGDQTLDWDIEGRLSKVTEPGKTTSFIYDAQGARLVRKDPTGTTLYLGGQELRLDTASATVTGTRYYSFGDGAVAMRTATTPTTSELTWLAGDHQGTAQIAVKNESMAVTRRRQTPFGAPRGQGVAFPGEKGFVGGTIDSSIGLTALGARQYDPTTGRFISVDPVLDLADPQSWNGYVYSNNSPITFSDPSGLWFVGGEDDSGNQYGHSYMGGHTTVIGNADAVKGKRTSKASSAWTTKKSSHVRDRGRGFVEEYDGDEDRYYVNGLPLHPSAPRAADLIEGAKQHYGGDLLGAPGTDAQLENTFGALLSYCREVETANCDSEFYSWLTLEWTEFLGEKGYFDGAGGRGGSGFAGLRSRLGLSPKRGCSFDGDTEVLMADGTTKPISAMKAGDMVLAADPETGESGPRMVSAVMVHEDTVLELVIEHGAEITTTEDHPFWNATDRAWQRADQLDAGESLLTSTGEYLRVSGLRAGSEHVASAYNLTVDDLHTYYVVAGNAPVLVHNTCPTGGARFTVDSNGVVTDLRPPSRGSTGRTTPGGANEQNALDLVQANAQYGNRLPLRMNDPRWHADDGWVKMEQTVNDVEIHYVYNMKTGVADDFKFKDWSN